MSFLCNSAGCYLFVLLFCFAVVFVVIIVSLCLSGFILESFGPNVGSCVVVLGYLCLYVCVCVWRFCVLCSVGALLLCLKLSHYS